MAADEDPKRVAKLRRKNNLGYRSVRVLEVEDTGKGTGRQRGKHRERMATIGTVVVSKGDGSWRGNAPALGIGAAIRRALDPAQVPSRGTTMDEMTSEQRAEMHRLYDRPPPIDKSERLQRIRDAATRTTPDPDPPRTCPHCHRADCPALTPNARPEARAACETCPVQ